MNDDKKVSLLSEEDEEILGELNEEEVSAEVLKHVSNPRNVGSLKDPDGQAMLRGICEDSMLIQLNLKGM